MTCIGFSPSTVIGGNQSGHFAIFVDHQQHAHAGLNHPPVGFIDTVTGPDQRRAREFEVGHYAYSRIIERYALGQILREAERSRYSA
jgi:hypothetical protein